MKKSDDNQKIYREFSEKLLSMMMLAHQLFFRKTMLPLPLNQCILLSIVNAAEKENELLTMQEISQRTRLSKQQLTPLANKLVQDNYLTRQSYPKDRRFIQLMLTEKGRQVIASSENQIIQRIEKVSSEFPAEEIMDNYQILQNLIEFFKRIKASEERTHRHGKI